MPYDTPRMPAAKDAPKLSARMRSSETSAEACCEDDWSARILGEEVDAPSVPGVVVAEGSAARTTRGEGVGEEGVGGGPTKKPDGGMNAPRATQTATSGFGSTRAAYAMRVRRSAETTPPP
jgi:hypothetical protein